MSMSCGWDVGPPESQRSCRRGYESRKEGGSLEIGQKVMEVLASEQLQRCQGWPGQVPGGMTEKLTNPRKVKTKATGVVF